MTFSDWINYWDKVLFILIHNDSQHSFLDPIMLALRNPLTWIPLYLFIIFYSLKKAGSKAWPLILFSVILIGFSNTLSSEILKPFFARARPCFDDSLHKFLRNIVDCGGIYSMPSTHAVNHFAMASFWYWIIYLLRGKKWNWLWIWAALIGYA